MPQLIVLIILIIITSRSIVNHWSVEIFLWHSVSECFLLNSKMFQFLGAVKWPTVLHCHTKGSHEWTESFHVRENLVFLSLRREEKQITLGRKRFGRDKVPKCWWFLILSQEREERERVGYFVTPDAFDFLRSRVFAFTHSSSRVFIFLVISRMYGQKLRSLLNYM